MCKFYLLLWLLLDFVVGYSFIERELYIYSQKLKSLTLSALYHIAYRRLTTLQFFFSHTHILVKICNTQTILQDSCPPFTRCVESREQQPGSFNGFCKCIVGYNFNPNYNKK